MGLATSHVISQSAQGEATRSEKKSSIRRAVMSRAFVKNLDDTVEELPDRPVSPHPNLVTAEGLAHIEEEVARLKREQAAAHEDNARAALTPAARAVR